MIGQISLEFLIALAAYLTFLLILVKAFSNFTSLAENNQERLLDTLEAQSISVIYFVSGVNNKWQKANISVRGCLISEDEISCGTASVRRYVYAGQTVRYEYEIT